MSRRAIVNLLINPNISFGFWINENLVGARRTVCDYARSCHAYPNWLLDVYLEGIRAFNVAFTATIIHPISHTQCSLFLLHVTPSSLLLSKSLRSLLCTIKHWLPTRVAISTSTATSTKMQCLTSCSTMSSLSASGLTSSARAEEYLSSQLLPDYCH